MTDLKFEFKDFEFKQSELGTDEEVCDECGGQGEIIYGDGGGYGGAPTDTGYSHSCDACGGTGDKGLEYWAKKAVASMKEVDRGRP